MQENDSLPVDSPWLSEAAVAAGMRRFEKSFGRRYALRVHHADRLHGGGVVYIANHFHQFDPIFVLYAIARSGGIAPRQLAKPSLYRLPVIGRAMRRYRTIVTPRPTMGEDLDFDAYDRLKAEVVGTLAAGGAISLAYAGRMTRGYGIGEEALAGERAAAQTGLFTMIRELRGVRIVPVAVETYERRTPLNLLRAVLTLTGIDRLLPRGRGTAVDVAFGDALDVDRFLAEKDPGSGRPRTRRSLGDAIVLEIHRLRRKLQALNAGDAARSLERYS